MPELQLHWFKSPLFISLEVHIYCSLYTSADQEDDLFIQEQFVRCAFKIFNFQTYVLWCMNAAWPVTFINLCSLESKGLIAEDLTYIIFLVSYMLFNIKWHFMSYDPYETNKCCCSTQAPAQAVVFVQNLYRPTTGFKICSEGRSGTEKVTHRVRAKHQISQYLDSNLVQNWTMLDS